MKPAPFAYRAPDSLEEALALLREHGGDAKVLAGGQSLIPMMSFRLAQPALLVDCARLPGLSFVEAGADGGLRLGAMTPVRQLERHSLVQQRAPLFRLAAPSIAHPQIRNRGTVGGSLAHADPAAELPALAVAADARLRLRSAGGERWVEARDFFVGLLTTCLEPDEMVTEIALPPAPPHTGWAFQEVARRHGDYAQIGLGARITVDEAGRCRSARLVFLSAGDCPVDAAGAAASLADGPLNGGPLDEAAFAAAADLARREVDPSTDIHASADFKRHLAAVLTRRVLREATERARRHL
jgi:CO/xanthine dehydrogenase FAD-binding subunit